MTQIRKYANLPDLDSAPDVYETPGLTDDVSTTQASTTERSSGESSYDEDSEGVESGVDRRRLKTDDARLRFGSSKVDARKADFSDRIRRKKGSYRTANRVTRKHSGYPSDDESEEESLQRKLRRLRQEIEEAKAECEQNEQTSPEDHDVDAASEIAKLSQMLDSVYTQGGRSSSAETQLASVLSRPLGAAPALHDANGLVANGERMGMTKTPAAAQYDRNLSEILAKAAEFDSRLAQLETSLGVSSSTPQDLVPQDPVLKTIESLDQQLSIIANAPSTYETAARRLQDLQRQRREIEVEDEATSKIKINSTGGSKANGTPSADAAQSYLDDPTNAEAIKALYSALPAIESMAPTLPLVVERLRSLRLIHASAGDASTTLDEMRTRQQEQEAEIKAWREALDKVKEALKDGEGVLKENMDVVGGWVKDLEARVQKFS
ncbi:hypothetical protein P152DRAFT_460377 [Eremomyces bilateralis CBS 781.70]|uniref:Dynactin subunit n=1 Tax=Eremomyces bilateralis CBS 781.70 TaxID=1392243 RepID=A0A6G1FXS1_9PEZI|nr:uncharacterized protein P152DRAFT_460377 [Eremomyces bilateralis CBS 781.70]KAF1810685.1 hypothetical protein P152DRAFT_460377 [Eremomyces bilateralis CBS 781.70]